jgi:hypothetical protein
VDFTDEIAEKSVKSFFIKSEEVNMTDTRIIKIEFFVPESQSESIRLALGQAGFGRIGRYGHCAAETRVRGYWRPLEGAKPHTGRPGEIASADEVKVELVCRAERAAEAVGLIRRLHPYEEPLIMVIPLLNEAVEGSTTDIA